jgi:segregation and condensation protein A
MWCTPSCTSTTGGPRSRRGSRGVAAAAARSRPHACRRGLARESAAAGAGGVFPGAPEIAAEDRGADITALLRACLVALKVPEARAAALRPRPAPLWSVSDAIGRVRELLPVLPVLPEGGTLRDFPPRIGLEMPRRQMRCRAAVATTLIAGLDLARTGELALGQGDAWSPVRVRRGDGERAGGGGRVGQAA